MGCQQLFLSNKTHEFTQQCVQEFLGHHAFRCVLGQREGIPRKPHPAGALEIADQLAVSCENCIYVGDTSTDMQTAVAAECLLSVLPGDFGRAKSWWTTVPTK